MNVYIYFIKLNICLLCNVLLYRSLHKSLRKGAAGTGYLVVIDFHRDDSKIWSKPKGWVMDHVRAPQDVFRAEIESAGFKLVAEPEVEGLVENYVMIFEPI
jgi:predicted methyltransferase